MTSFVNNLKEESSLKKQIEHSIRSFWDNKKLFIPAPYSVSFSDLVMGLNILLGWGKTVPWQVLKLVETVMEPFSIFSCMPCFIILYLVFVT